MREDIVMTNENEDEAAYRDMTCSVCYLTMKEIADQRQESDGLDPTEKLGVANQCLRCTAIMCHDCLVDWAQVTIEKLHVPEAWNNIDLLKLKCSSQNCDEHFTVARLQRILDASRFERLSLALNKRVFQSSDQFIACPNAECSAFSFFCDEQYGDDY